jgi:hypothetical protein
MLAAAHGDGIWIDYGDPKDPRRMLIDGGPASTYAGGLQAHAVAVNGQQARPLHFELFVITHIDADHIDVPLIFLRDPAVPATFGDVWFNGWEQLQPENSPDILAPLQGEFLTSILGDPTAKRPWNHLVRSKPIAIADEGRLPTFDLDGGMRITVVAPGTRELTRLRARWESAIRDFTPGDFEEARRRLEARKDYEPPEIPDVFGAKTFGSDRTPANGSSIAVVAERNGVSVLLAGDAHARVLAQGLRRLAAERGEPTVRLDAYKMAHHGSVANVTPELLDLITCPRYLFSTSGAKFNHPDAETVDLVLAKAKGDVELYFNYSTGQPGTFAGRAGPHCKVTFGQGGNLAVDLEPDV